MLRNYISAVRKLIVAIIRDVRGEIRASYMQGKLLTRNTISLHSHFQYEFLSTLTFSALFYFYYFFKWKRHDYQLVQLSFSLQSTPPFYL